MSSLPDGKFQAMNLVSTAIPERVSPAAGQVRGITLPGQEPAVALGSGDLTAQGGIEQVLAGVALRNPGLVGPVRNVTGVLRAEDRPDGKAVAGEAVL